jgi:hypothetical protein
LPAEEHDFIPEGREFQFQSPPVFAKAPAGELNRGLGRRGAVKLRWPPEIPLKEGFPIGAEEEAFAISASAVKPKFK